MAKSLEPSNKAVRTADRLTIDSLRDLYGPLVRPSPADFNAHSAVAHIIETFARHEVTFSRDSNADQRLRFQAASVAVLSYSQPDHLLFQDPISRSLIDRLEKAAREFGEAIEDVWGYGMREAETGKLNLCEGFFPDDKSHDEVTWAAISVINAAEVQQGFGIKPVGRGRQPLHVFYDFVRRLHSIYVSKTGRKGFYEKNGTAVGDFIELAFEAQSILPKDLRHSDVRTIGNRVIEAFKEKNTLSF